MLQNFSIRLPAARLLEALDDLVPETRQKHPKPFSVTMSYSAKRQRLDLTEAVFGSRSIELPAHGTWPKQVQVEGRMLRKICGSFPADAVIELIPTSDELCLLRGASEIRLKRLDPSGSQGLKRKPLPKPRGHLGPVRVPPDPVGKRVELDATWDFSARMPVPQHRDKKN
jgi:hypothetical protein